jgi:hypothetical protein
MEAMREHAGKLEHLKSKDLATLVSLIHQRRVCSTWEMSIVLNEKSFRTNPGVCV